MGYVSSSKGVSILPGRSGRSFPRRPKIASRKEFHLFVWPFLYPRDLRQGDSPSRLRRSLERSKLLVRVISEGDEGDWAECSVSGLTDILRRSYELLVSEDVVATSVADLENAIEVAAEQMSSSSATPIRLRRLLGIPEETDSTVPETDEE